VQPSASLEADEMEKLGTVAVMYGMTVQQVGSGGASRIVLPVQLEAFQATLRQVLPNLDRTYLVRPVLTLPCHLALCCWSP
jgi:hypothetical protein